MPNIVTSQQVKSQHPIPQNVMDVEFKIVGDLTLHQFVLVAVGAGFAFVFYKTVRPVPINWLAALLTFGTAAAIAFIPLDDRGLDQWLINFINAVTKPTQRMWRKNPQPPSYLLGEYAQMVTSEIVSLAPARSRSELIEYLQRLDTPENREEILETKENDFLKRISQEQPLISGLSQTPPTTTAATAPTAKAQYRQQQQEEEVFFIPTEEGLQEVVKAIKNTQPGRSLSLENFRETPGMGGDSLVLPIKGEVVIESVKKQPPNPTSKKSNEEEAKTVVLLRDLHNTINLARESLNKVVETSKTVQTPPPNPVKDNVFRSDDFKKEMVKSRLKQLTGQLNTLKERQQSGESSLEKTIQYYQQQIKGLEERLEGKSAVDIDNQSNSEEIMEKIDSLKKQSLIFQNQIESINKTIAISKQIASQNQDKRQLLLIEQQEQTLNNLAENKKSYESQIDNLVQRLKLQMTPLIPQEEPVTKTTAGTQRQEQRIKVQVKPNIVYGTIRDRDGHLLENAVIIIKDERHEPVRALKTNKLGQFRTSTPLSNGEYTVLATKPGLSFNTAKINLMGAVINEIELLAQ